MKKFIRMICLLIAAVLLLAGCAKGSVTNETAATATGVTNETAATAAPAETAASPAGTTTPAAALAADLMANISAREAQTKAADDKFVSAQMSFDLALFKALAKKCRQSSETLLVSPLSVALALAMIANGAAGQTREEMETLLGGEISLEDLNAYLCAYLASIPENEKCKFTFADSIWLRNRDLTVKTDFLQTNADYYNAGAYAVPFDEETLKQVNEWVSDHTDGMIERILDKLSPDTALLLINTLCFDAEWETIYDESNITEMTFYAPDGEQTAEMMCSRESVFLRGDRATGFLKPYAGGRYSFAALLPDAETDVFEYASTLTAQGLLDMLKNAESENVSVRIPKFKSENKWELEKYLPALGMPTAFSGGADFSGISETNALVIGAVTHKTFIEVNERGTKAGAATVIDIRDGGISLTTQFVWLDRPFVYMIIDNETNLPIFMGIQTSVA